MSLEKKYKKSLDEQWCLRFKTRHPDEDNYDGVVTHIKKGFIVLRQEEAFEFDGTVILSKKSIAGYRDDKHEQCVNSILRENGAIKKCYAPRWLGSCETLQEVIAELMRRDIWPGIEIVWKENTKSAFYLGLVTRMMDDHFYLRCYDAAGKWEKEYKLRYEEIFRIEINSMYCRHFNAYMRKHRST